MARNEEKALTLFSKWQTFKKDFHASGSNRRPLLASSCESLPDAEKYRRELVSDLTKKMAAIRNAALGEHKVRELNDDINKLMKKKHYWEIRIRELGGNVPMGKQLYDIDGKELPGAPGYRYYGAAKELPGVRELFAEQEEFQSGNSKKSKRSRAELYQHITPDYYGFRDDEDGQLEPLEATQEAELLRKEPRAIHSAESDDEFEQLSLLPQISQAMIGITNASNMQEEDGTIKKSALAILEEQQKVQIMEYSKKQLLSKFDM